MKARILYSVLLLALVAGVAWSQAFYANQPIADSTVFARNWEGSAAITGTSPSSGPCLDLTRSAESVFVAAACSPAAAVSDTGIPGAGIIFTSLSISMGQVASTAVGCAACLSNDGGATCIPGTTVNVPAADGQSSDGGETAYFNYVGQAGDWINIVGLESPYSEAGGEGTCGTNSTTGWIRVGGVF